MSACSLHSSTSFLSSTSTARALQATQQRMRSTRSPRHVCHARLDGAQPHPQRPNRCQRPHVLSSSPCQVEEAQHAQRGWPQRSGTCAPLWDAELLQHLLQRLVVGAGEAGRRVHQPAHVLQVNAARCGAQRASTTTQHARTDPVTGYHSSRRKAGNWNPTAPLLPCGEAPSAWPACRAAVCAGGAWRPPVPAGRTARRLELTEREQRAELLAVERVEVQQVAHGVDHLHAGGLRAQPPRMHRRWAPWHPHPHDALARVVTPCVPLPATWMTRVPPPRPTSPPHLEDVVVCVRLVLEVLHVHAQRVRRNLRPRSTHSAHHTRCDSGGHFGNAGSGRRL